MIFNFYVLQLNAEGLVDAVITEDSDTFCYGAEVILRNFSISASGPSVEMYTASRLDELLGLTRDRIVFLAILLGCDFFPTGIPGKDIKYNKQWRIKY